MQTLNKVTALLPIKKDSERVESKNFRLMCGKPLYQWVLETLLSCEKVKKELPCIILSSNNNCMPFFCGKESES